MNLRKAAQTLALAVTKDLLRDSRPLSSDDLDLLEAAFTALPNWDLTPEDHDLLQRLLDLRLQYDAAGSRGRKLALAVRKFALRQK